MTIKPILKSLLCLVTLLIGFAIFPVHAASSDLVKMLTSQLGVTGSQAEGGAGSIFKLAKSTLEESEFSDIANAVPGIDGLIKAAPNDEKSDSGLGAVTSLLGGSSNTLGSLATLTSSFSQLGLNPEMVNQFVPIVLDYVDNKGGEQVKNLLAGVLK